MTGRRSERLGALTTPALATTGSRSDGLADLLPARALTVVDDSPAQHVAQESTAAPDPDVEQPATGDPAGAVLRGVTAYLDPPLAQRLRDAAADGRTYGDVVLDCFEQLAADGRLDDVLGAADRPGPTGLFQRGPARPRRRAARVEVQLRLTRANADVIDQLVARSAMASRSAAITAVLTAALPRGSDGE